MDCLRIEGGRRVIGTVAASGSKNAALPIMAAAILGERPSTLHRVPRVTDVATLRHVLEAVGVASRRLSGGQLLLDPDDRGSCVAPAKFVQRMRASFCVLGPLVARRGRGVVALPGGCAIGERPVNLHLAALEALGAEIRIESGHVVAAAKRLHGGTIDWRMNRVPTVTGTANLLCAAALARGKTVIRGAAKEPEIVDLGRFLIAMGAHVAGLGSDTIEIVGQDSLDGAEHEVIPDRIETATLLLAGAITEGSVQVLGTRPEHLRTVLELLTLAGCSVEVDGGAIHVSRDRTLRAVGFTAGASPLIPTDLQPLLSALMSVGLGTSLISDRVFPERFLHASQLKRLGASAMPVADGVIIHGGQALQGRVIRGTDLRATAALVLAGLAAGGTTTVKGIRHLDRGYERLDVKLRQLGAQITRHPSPSAQTVDEALAEPVAPGIP